MGSRGKREMREKKRKKRGERSFRISWDCSQEQEREGKGKKQGMKWLADLWRVRCSLARSLACCSARMEKWLWDARHRTVSRHLDQCNLKPNLIVNTFHPLNTSTSSYSLYHSCLSSTVLLHLPHQRHHGRGRRHRHVFKAPCEEIDCRACKEG